MSFKDDINKQIKAGGDVRIANTNLSIDDTGMISDKLAAQEMIKSLTLQGAGAGPQQLERLAAGIKKSKKLKILNLSDNPLQDVGAQTLGDTMRDNTSIETLLVFNNGLTANGIVGIVEALEDNKTLRNLRVNNPINDDGMSKIAAALAQNKSLYDVSLLNAGAGDEGIVELLTSVIGTNIAKVNLKGSTLTEEGVKMVAKIMKVSTNLRELRLTSNNLTHEAIKALAAGVTRTGNSSLTVVHLEEVDPHGISVAIVGRAIERKFRDLIAELSKSKNLIEFSPEETSLDAVCTKNKADAEKYAKKLFNNSEFSADEYGEISARLPAIIAVSERGKKTFAEIANALAKLQKSQLEQGIVKTLPIPPIFLQDVEPASLLPAVADANVIHMGEIEGLDDLRKPAISPEAKKRGTSKMYEAIRNGQFPQIKELIKNTGEVLSAEELTRKPSETEPSMVELAMRYQQLPDLFDPAIWVKNPRGMRRVRDSIASDEEVKRQLGDFSFEERLSRANEGAVKSLRRGGDESSRG